MCFGKTFTFTEQWIFYYKSKIVSFSYFLSKAGQNLICSWISFCKQNFFSVLVLLWNKNERTSKGILYHCCTICSKYFAWPFQLVGEQALWCGKFQFFWCTVWPWEVILTFLRLIQQNGLRLIGLQKWGLRLIGLQKWGQSHKVSGWGLSQTTYARHLIRVSGIWELL